MVAMLVRDKNRIQRLGRFADGFRRETNSFRLSPASISSRVCSVPIKTEFPGATRRQNADLYDTSSSINALL